MRTAIKVMSWITAIIYSLLLLVSIGDPTYVEGDPVIVLGAFYLIAQSGLTLLYLHSEE